MGIVSTPPIAAPLRHTSLEQEMRQSYVDYAMSVIVARALPDVRDGLKPVHRRILYAMMDAGYSQDKPHRKSARVVGDVMGKYHPHGDASIYDAMVKMAQPFTSRLPLIDGQGNFGSPDGDPPAAMRYTEARLSPAGHALLDDLDEGTVAFRPNYDGTLQQPSVLPAEFPNILVNGGEGIAVGMATKMAPHNLGEVILATLARLDNPDISLDELMLLMPGPDFPTGGVIHGRQGIRDAYTTGSGSIPVAGVYNFETTPNGRVRIIFTQLPYKVNKEALLANMAKLVNEKEIEGISDLRDESEGDVRLVIEIKRDANPDVVLARLQKRTAVTQSFSINANCLDRHGQPQVMPLLQILDEFIAFRRECIQNRTRFRLEAARDNLGKQVGLFAARSKVDEVIKLIRASASPDIARQKLMEMNFDTAGDLAALLREVDPDAEPEAIFRLSDAQVRQVLRLPLNSLTTLEGEKIIATAREISASIIGLDAILRNSSVLDDVMRTELAVIKARHATPRLTEIKNSALEDINEDDLIEDSPVVLSLTQQGYIKITPLAAYREQARGGKGKSGMETKDADTVVMTLICSLRTRLLFFTSRGIVHALKAYKIKESAASGRGRPAINFIRLNQGETITAILPMEENGVGEDRFLMFVTDTGDVRRNPVSDFARVPEKGLVAMKLEDDNGRAIARLIAVRPCTEAEDLVLATRRGKAVRFPVPEVRVFKGRNSIGNKGITLASGDEVINAAILRHFEAEGVEREAYFSDDYTTTWVDEATNQTHSLTLSPERVAEMKAAEQTLLVVTSLGYGKRFSSLDFRTTDRGVQGVWVGTFGPKTGHLMACFPVEAEDGIMLQTDGGQAIRTRCSEIRVMRRGAQGVTLFDLPKGQHVADVAHIPAEEE